MEISNYTVILSSTVVMTGWIVNNILSRRHEIAKKRLEYRLETLHGMIQADKAIQEKKELNDTVIEAINVASINFQLYGYQDEIDILSKFLDAIDKRNTKDILKYNNKLVVLVKSRLRDELKLPKLK